MASIYGGYESQVALGAGTRQVVSDAAFEATISEVHRATKREQLLTGVTVDTFFPDKFDEGLRGIGLKRVKPSSGSFGTAGFAGEGEYTLPTRSEYAKYEEQLVEAGYPSLDDLDKEYGEAVKKSEQDVGSAFDRASTGTIIFGSLGGGIAAMAQDPVQLATLPVGAQYRGGSIIAFAVREALIQGTLSAGTEKLIVSSKEELFERTGIDRDDTLNILMATGAGTLLGGVAGGIGAAVNRASVNKAVDKLVDKTFKDADEGALALVQEMENVGYKFDARQQQIINTAKHYKVVADGNVRNLSPTDQVEMGKAMEIMDRKIRGESTPDDDAVLRELMPSTRHETIDLLDTRIRAVKAEIKARQQVEARAKPSKPLKKMQQALSELEQEQAKVRAEVERTAKSLQSGTRRVMDALDNESFADVRMGRAEREYFAARKRADDLRQKQADKLDNGREVKARERKALAKADADAMAARDRMNQARKDYESARAELAKAQKAKAKAEAKVNEGYSDPARIEALNEKNWGFKWKKRKVEKGAQVRPPRDIVSTASGTRGAKVKDEAPAPDGGLPDDVAMNEAIERATELAERIDPTGSQALKEALAELSEFKKGIDGIKQAIACNRGAV